jgi:hypothetical protein
VSAEGDSGGWKNLLKAAVNQRFIFWHHSCKPAESLPANATHNRIEKSLAAVTAVEKGCSAQFITMEEVNHA